ncbi:MAG TPA: DUF3011 domain-containing protein [Rhodanobacteraceae bacterium]|nr:DUF3011 domain-containing protein [Rhodanobacteraceae bacterium]
MVTRCAFLVLVGLLFVPVGAHAQGRRGGAVDCASRDYRPTHCSVPWRNAVLVRQTSSAACIEGRTWGVDRRGIWVDKGCSGEFAEARRGGGHGQGAWRPGQGWDRTIAVRCDSNDFRYHFCQVDTGRGSRVTLHRQLSDTRCVEGRTWGWNRAGIWVNGGCSGLFHLERRWR